MFTQQASWSEESIEEIPHLQNARIYRHFGIKLRKHWIFFPPAFCHIQSKQTKFLGTEKVVTLLLSR